MNHAASSRSSASPDAAAALRGASLAFQPRPAATAAKATGDNSSSASSTSSASSASKSRTGASATAHPHRSRSPHRGRDLSGTTGTTGTTGNANPSNAVAHKNGSRLDAKNPSFIAATLAASRSASPRPFAQKTPQPRCERSSGGGHVPAASVSSDAVDSESIPPTERLVSLFEQQGKGGTSGPTRRSPLPPLDAHHKGVREEQRQVQKVSPAASHKPTSKLKPKQKPRPPSSPPASLPPAETESDTSNPDPVSSTRLPTPPPTRSAERIYAMPMPKPKPPPHLSLPFPHASCPPLDQKQARPPVGGKPRPSSPRRGKAAANRPPRAPPRDPSAASASSTSESSEPKNVRSGQPVLEPPRHKKGRRGSSQATLNRGASNQSSPSPDPDPEKPSTKPRLDAAITQNKPTASSSSSSSSSRTEFGLPVVSQPRPPPPPPRTAFPKKFPPKSPPLPDKKDNVVSAPGSPVREPRFSCRRLTTTSSTSNLPLDTLTNAIMASSLASARLTPHNTGSSLPPPILPQRHKSPRLLQTLRQPQRHEDHDPERVKIAHRHKLSSNKHAHHEGARKRWRDQVTQRERKRYEAVWASNRGLLLLLPLSQGQVHVQVNGGEPSGPNRAHKSECVSNVVVRELWKRSRLPQDELMEVWELVDRGHDGMLTRQEFVVGMWLIDQRLKGRKMPARVSESVWHSANGVRLLQPGKK
ncbi:hypothetical protein E4U39_007352 [Claviceps sp. Clav50 group G5]|nr:hypothetical protein E4U39_007352 [Claviceps sp. Clav50 group G5]